MRAIATAALAGAALLLISFGISTAHEVENNGPAHPRLKHFYRKPATAAPPEAAVTFPRAYPWGYFGAQPTRRHVSHRGYYGEYYEWGYYRAY